MAKKVAKKKKVGLRAGGKPDEKLTRLEAIRAALESMEEDGLYEDEVELITASKIQLPTGYLSHSAVEAYLGCPMQYKFRYIDKIQTPPAVALEEGSSHHFALETNNLHKIKTGEDLPLQTIKEAFEDDFSSRKKSIEEWEDEDPDNVIRRGGELVKAYRTTFAPNYFPQTAERCFAISVGPVPVVGFIDTEGLISQPRTGTKGAKVAKVDYKTVKRAKSQKDADGSLQLSVYGHTETIKDEDVEVDAGFCSLVKTTKKVNYIKTVVDYNRTRWARRVILSVANQISLGNFPLTAPDSWRCSERFCGSWKQCRGKYQ